jgi:prepilin-type N-terminal cleavage/methylation domain-containing protein
MSADPRSGGIGAVPGRDEAGFTLVELLITLVIMSLAVVTVVTTMGVAANASDEQRQQVDVGLALSNAAEALQSTVYNSTTACSAPYGPYATAAGNAPLPPDWSFAGAPASTAQVQSVDCTSFTNLQTITLFVTSPNGRATGSLSLLKRSP